MAEHMQADPDRRIVITGLGVLACNGIGKEDFWEACISGRSGIRRITRFDAGPLSTQIAGEIAHFDPEAVDITREERLYLDRGTQFAIAAANLALQDAGLYGVLDEEERDHMGVYLGTAMASVEEGERIWLQFTGSGTRTPGYAMQDIVPATLLMSYVPASAIAIHHQLHGPCTVISTGCSAGADAIGQAFWAIQEGRADRMLAGGSDSAISYTGMNVFCVIRALSTRNEEREIALARGAHVYAELIAFTSNSNAYHMTALPEDGAPLRQLLRQAMHEAQIAPEQLDYINSHGSSTPYNEAAETAAYKAVFGKRAYGIPISATKSMIGHAQGAASAIEAIVTALVLERQMLPPTINQELVDPLCDLDYVANVARQACVNVALTHSSGFGGMNTALILARPDWIDTHDV